MFDKVKENVDAEVHYYLGECQFQLGNYADCLESFRRAETAIPQMQITKSPQFLFSSGNCKSKLENWEGSLENLTSAVELDAHNTTYISARGAVLAQLGHHDMAEQTLELAITIAKKEKGEKGEKGEKKGIELWFLLKQLAHSLCEQRKYAQASETYHESIVQTGYGVGVGAGAGARELGFLHYHRGICLARLKRFKRACNAFTKGLEAPHGGNVNVNVNVNDNDSDNDSDLDNVVDPILFYHERAKCLQMIGKHEDAIEDFSKVIKEKDDDDRAIFRRGWSYKNLGLLLLAAEDFERAKGLNPEKQIYDVNYRCIGDVETIILLEAGKERLP